jgi:hypothetical protein
LCSTRRLPALQRIAGYPMSERDRSSRWAAILIIEDARRRGDQPAQWADRCRVTSCSGSRQGNAALVTLKPMQADLILMSLMFPYADGLVLCSICQGPLPGAHRCPERVRWRDRSSISHGVWRDRLSEQAHRPRGASGSSESNSAIARLHPSPGLNQSRKPAWRALPPCSSASSRAGAQAAHLPDQWRA